MGQQAAGLSRRQLSRSGTAILYSRSSPYLISNKNQLFGATCETNHTANFLCFFNECSCSLPIRATANSQEADDRRDFCRGRNHRTGAGRSEEHTSELQSRPHLVCRLL